MALGLCLALWLRLWAPGGSGRSSVAMLRALALAAVLAASTRRGARARIVLEHEGAGLALLVRSPSPLQAVERQAWVGVSLVAQVGDAWPAQHSLAAGTLPPGVVVRVRPLENAPDGGAAGLSSGALNFSLRAQTPDMGCVEAWLSRRRLPGSASGPARLTPGVSACWVAPSSLRPSSADALLPQLAVRAAAAAAGAAAAAAPTGRNAATGAPLASGAVPPRRVVVLGGLGGYDGMKRMLVWQIEALAADRGDGRRFHVDYMEGRCLAGHEGRAWTRLLRPVLLPPAAEADAAFHPDGVPGSGGDGAEGDDGAVMLGIGPGSDALLALESAGAPVEVVEAVRAGARFVSGCIRFPRAGSRVQAGHASGSGDGDEAAAAAAAATAAAAAGGSSAGADDAETARLLANVLLPEAPASLSGAGHKQPPEARGRDMAALSSALKRLPAAAAARAWHAVSPLARFLLGVDVFVQANGFAMPGPATAVAHLVRLVAPASARVLALGAWPLLDPRYLSRQEAGRLLLQRAADAAGFGEWVADAAAAGAAGTGGSPDAAAVAAAAGAAGAGERPEPLALGGALAEGVWAVRDAATDRAVAAFASSAGSLERQFPFTTLQPPSLHVLQTPGVATGPRGTSTQLVVTGIDVHGRWNPQNVRHCNTTAGGLAEPDCANAGHPVTTAAAMAAARAVACDPGHAVAAAAAVDAAALRAVRGALCSSRAPPPGAGARTLRRLQDDGLVTVLLFSARFSGVKGLGATLRAMLALLRRGALPTLPVLVMATQTKSPGLAAAVQSAVAALPELAPFVRWQGYVPPSEAPLMVWAADVFVAPFLNPITETLGLAPLEAMALGRTVVHCAAGGMRDYTEPQAPARGARGGTGQGDVVASLPAWSGCDFEGVALAMDTALRGGPDFRRRVGQRARRVVVDNFSDDVWKPVLRAAYA